MPVLTFSGDFVAADFSIDSNNKNFTFFDVQETPFLSTDIVRIEIADSSVGPNGEFDPNEVIFESFSVERDGVVYEFGVDSGSKIKESGDGSNPEQGDTFFLTNDSISPPPTGPFAGLEEQTYLFSSDTSFAGGPGRYKLDRKDNDAGGSGNGTFNANSAAVCFAEGTPLATPNGDIAVENLTVGTLLTTLDHGAQPVRAITFSEYRWPGAPASRLPVLIAKGALGAGLPVHDLVVSPQHRVLLPGGTGAAQSPRLAAAKALVSLPGIRVRKGARNVRYYHILMDRHEVLFASGTPCESFFPGEVALRSLSNANNAITMDVLSSKGANWRDHYAPAYPLAPAGQVRRETHSLDVRWTDESFQRLMQTAKRAA